ncbi:MAG: hypothetical protein ACO3QX_09395 [Ilumatobacteraceae bacterium]
MADRAPTTYPTARTLLSGHTSLTEVSQALRPTEAVGVKVHVPVVRGRTPTLEWS